jgi:hypothetical protein
MWLQYGAIDKTTKEQVTIHILHKKKIPSYWEESLFELMKRDAQLLSRLRHPYLLRVLKPLDESRSALVLVTEPLVGSLANVMDATRRPRPYESELEPKEALDFGTVAVCRRRCGVGFLFPLAFILLVCPPDEMCTFLVSALSHQNAWRPRQSSAPSMPKTG